MSSSTFGMSAPPAREPEPVFGDPASLPLSPAPDDGTVEPVIRAAGCFMATRSR